MTAVSHILCPVDFSGPSRAALAYAAAAARWYGARMTVLHVLPEAPMVDIIPSLAAVGASPRTAPGVDRHALRAAAEDFVAGSVPDGTPFDLWLAADRNAALDIADAAEAGGVDLIVMAAQAHEGLSRLLRESVTEAVLQAAPCPVLVIPPRAAAAVTPGDAAFDHLLCAVDFSGPSIDALGHAVLLAEDADAHLTLLNVVEQPPELRERSGRGDVDVPALRAADAAARLRHLRQLVPESARTYCRVETMVGEGSPAHEILRVAAEQGDDLIVMGGRGRGAEGPFAGSTVQRVLQRAVCPVLVVDGG